jgi:hypothetical protein
MDSRKRAEAKNNRVKARRINIYYKEQASRIGRCEEGRAIYYWNGNMNLNEGKFDLVTQVSIISDCIRYGSKKNGTDDGVIIKGAIVMDRVGKHFIVPEERIRMQQVVFVGKADLTGTQMTGPIDFGQGRRFRLIEYYNKREWVGEDTEVKTASLVRNRKETNRNMYHNPGIAKILSELTVPELTAANVRILNEMVLLHEWNRTQYWERMHKVQDIDRHILEGNHHAAFSFLYGNYTCWIRMGAYLNPNGFHENWVEATAAGVGAADARDNGGEWGEQDDQNLGRWINIAASAPLTDQEHVDKTFKELKFGEKTQLMLMFDCFDASLIYNKLRHGMPGEIRELKDAGVSTEDVMTMLLKPHCSKRPSCRRKSATRKVGGTKFYCLSCKAREVVRSNDLCEKCSSGTGRQKCIHCKTRTVQRSGHSCFQCADAPRECKRANCARYANGGYGLCRPCREDAEKADVCPSCFFKLDNRGRCGYDGCKYMYKANVESCKTRGCNNKVVSYGLCRKCRQLANNLNHCPVCLRKLNDLNQCCCGYMPKCKAARI